MSRLDRFFKDVQNRRVSIVGCGISGRAVYEFLRRALPTLPITLYDDRAEAFSFALGDPYATLCALSGGACELVGDLVFRTPSLRPDLPAFLAVRRRGGRVLTETDLVAELCPCPLFGITGSDGKTTTATLTHRLLAEEGARRGFSAYLGGNVGQSLLPHLATMTERDGAVLELSSFQLMDSRLPLAGAAVLNVTENHLNWHTDMAEYAAAKARILSRAKRAVLFADQPTLASLAPEDACFFSATRPLSELVSTFGVDRSFVHLSEGWACLTEGGHTRPLFAVSCLSVRGVHMIENAMAASATVAHAVSEETVRAVLSTFRGVPHRLTDLGTFAGVRVIDSGADTTPSRTACSLAALECRPVVLCGGSDKGLSYAPLARALCERACAAVLTGATAPAILAAFPTPPPIPVVVEEDFASAVRLAHALARGCGTLLFSPACASFDRFANYVDRSRAFLQILSHTQP